MSKGGLKRFFRAGLLLVGLALVSLLVAGCGRPQTSQQTLTSPEPLLEAPALPSSEGSPRASGTESLPALAGSWEALPEMPRDLVALAVDPASAMLLYASTYSKGSEGGGLYRTEDGGLSWERVAGNEIGSPASRIDALALDDGTPSTLYAAAGGAVLASTDGGQTWSPRGSTGLEWSSTWQLWIAPSDREVLTIRTQGEGSATPLMRSVDGGRSWRRVDEAVPDRIISLALHPTDADVLYAGTPHGVFKTTDGGRTWASASNGIESDLSMKALAIDPTDPDTVYGGGEPGLVKSADGGRHWTSLEPGPCPGQFCCHSKAIMPEAAASGRLYMLCNGAPALAVSDDGGMNWRALASEEMENPDFTAFAVSFAPELVFVGSEHNLGGWRYGLAPLAASENQPAAAQAIGTPHTAGTSASYRPGDLIDADGLVVSVLGWSWAGEAAGYATPEPGLKYVVVDVVAYNGDRGDREINPFSQYTLRDADGQTYEYGGSHSQAWRAAFLQPGEMERDAPIFRVPEAAHGFTFVYQPDWMAEGYAYVDLGDQPLTLALPDVLRVSQPNSYALGDVVEYGDITFAVTGWQVTEAEGEVMPAPGTKLLAVEVALANRSEQELTLQMTNRVRLLDGNSIAYKPLEGVLPIPAFKWHGITLRRGEVLRAQVLFQVPEESQDYTLAYGGYSSPSAYVQLGAEPQVADVPAEMAALEGPTYEVGQVAESGDMTFALLGWALSEVQQTAEGGLGEQLLFVDLLLVSRGPTQEALWLNATLRDASFWQYERIDTYFDLWSREAWPQKLSQGEPTRGTVVFRVDPGATGYVFGLSGPSETRDMAFVSLGGEPFRKDVPAELVVSSPYALGETIRQGDAELAVLRWELSGGDPECPEPGEPTSAVPTAVSFSDRPVCPIEDYRFLIVELTVTNRGSQPTESLGILDAPTIRDATGYHYKVDQYYRVEGGALGPQEFGGIEPGEGRRGTFVYEVPLDSSGYAFVFDPTWLFGEEAGELIAVDLGR